MQMDTSELRRTVARQLRGSQAHAGLTAALEHLPETIAGQAVAGHAHTAWQQVEHMRLAAEDLVAYCTDPEYKALEWPDGYWPDGPKPPSTEAWSASFPTASRRHRAHGADRRRPRSRSICEGPRR